MKAMKLVAADVRRLHLKRRKTEIDQSLLTSAATDRVSIRGEGKLKESAWLLR